MAAALLVFCAFAAAAAAAALAPPPVLLSDASMARPFGGVGAISGGGATSRTLYDYPDAVRKTLMDLLWMPQYAGSFQTVKVEIPADCDTTCGSEVAYRHDAADGGSCVRGYEGWFLAEAAARRPGITSSALQWAAPAFVGEGAQTLFTPTNIEQYLLPWIRCMQSNFNANLTFIGGGWNEKPHNNTYIKLLRQALDSTNLHGVGIAAADQCCGSNWDIAYDMASDPELAAAVALISTHVAGALEENTPTPAVAMALGVGLWQGEEHIGLPDPDPVEIWTWAAAASVGVEISQNWVVNNMTATIYWPAAYGWSQGLAYRGKGFVTATCPWGSAPFLVPAALWVVAHTTHFTTPGETWLLNGTGSGHIGDGRVVTFGGAGGGWNVSYVTYVNNATLDLTLVIESFLAGGDWHAAPNGTQPEPATATFQLGGRLRRWTMLHLWHTNQSVNFERLDDIAVAPDGTFSIVPIEPGSIYTYTTVASSHPGGDAVISALQNTHAALVSGERVRDGPVDDPFPLPYADDFEGYVNDTLPLFSQDMFGAFTVFQLTDPAAMRGAPMPLRHHHASDEVRAAVNCGGTAAAAAARPSRCIAPRRAGGGNVLRQWTRQPPLGWGSDSSNMATLFGNFSLRNVNVSVAALIETVDSGFTPAQTPYVLIGLHGGQGVLGASSPGDFYRTGPDFDFAWFSVDGHWGCSISGSPAICATSHPLPSAFGYDTWHTVSFAEVPRTDGSADLELLFDGVLLFNVSQAAATQKNQGRGGYVGLVTGCHRAQFDNLVIDASPVRVGGVF